MNIRLLQALGHSLGSEHLMAVSAGFLMASVVPNTFANIDKVKPNATAVVLGINHNVFAGPFVF